MKKEPVIYTKPVLIAKLKEIHEKGWIPNARHGNAGGVGNTLEDLLRIKKNNLPIPNASEWELKTQRLNSSSLTTLFHMEPSPRAVGFVADVLLPKYGWPHQEARKKYPAKEVSFRMTISTRSRSDRGFTVVVDRKEEKVLILFDPKNADKRHGKWLASVKKRVGLGELNPQPYWGFKDLENKAGTKLLNSFYVQAEVQKKGKKEFYHYTKVMMLQKFSFSNFLRELEGGNILIDFDARSGHNHGTKFRIRQDCLPLLYEKATVII